MSVMKRFSHEEAASNRDISPLKVLHKEFPGQTVEQIERATEECRRTLGAKVAEERLRECIENRLTAHRRYSG